MVQPDTISFLEKLALNNNKAWFDENRNEYISAKEDFEKLVSDILELMARQEPALAGQKAKDCIFRIFRDVRFAKDKTPYKSHFGAYFSKGGKKYPGAGFYIHLEPGKSFAGGGLWSPEAPLLKAVRQEIDYNFAEFQKIINEKGFRKLFKEINGEQLKKMPQGYEEGNPAAHYIKMKGFTTSHTFSDKEVTAKTFVAKCVEVFTEMKPFVDFLNRSAD